jgi:hypothetical protein
MCRAGNMVYWFRNGTLVSTTGFTDPIAATTTVLTVGTLGNGISIESPKNHPVTANRLKRSRACLSSTWLATRLRTISGRIGLVT